MKNLKAITIRLPLDIYEKIKKQAIKEQRSVCFVINELVKERSKANEKKN